MSGRSTLRGVTDPAELFATPRVAAGALFFDDQGRVLLVHPTYKDTWDLPGGYVEHGESPAAACSRELREELGVDRQPSSLLSVDWAPSGSEGDKLLFLFDCGELSADDELEIQTDGQEISEWRWVALDDLDTYVIDRIAKRVRSTTNEKAIYLENGEPTLDSRSR